MERKTQNGAELCTAYTHAHTHTRGRSTRARARARFLHVDNGGRCGSSSVHDIGRNGTDISIIVSIRTGTGSVAPVRRSVRTSVCLSVRPSVRSSALAWLERCRARFKL